MGMLSSLACRIGADPFHVGRKVIHHRMSALASWLSIGSGAEH